MEHASAPKQDHRAADLDRVREAIGPVLSAHGVSMVDLEWTSDRGGRVLRLTIEREGAADLGGGVTLDDCADVSRDVSSVLDVEDMVHGHYNLEVSSPGLDRPLKTRADFARFVGQMARVKLTRPAPDGQRLLRGAIAEVTGTGPEADGTIAMIVDGKRIEVPYAHVAEANLVFELAPQPKKGASRGDAKRTSVSKDRRGKRSAARSS
jgi:ribosome maturation factor RimP